MSRDPRKLRVFHLADALVIDIYQSTKNFPDEERYGLKAQLRRAAVSAAANIVEGCARRRTGEYLNFLNIAAGSASETKYLLDVALRVGLLAPATARDMNVRCAQLVGGLVRLTQALSSPGQAKPKARA